MIISEVKKATNCYISATLKRVYNLTALVSTAYQSDLHVVEIHMSTAK